MDTTTFADLMPVIGRFIRLVAFIYALVHGIEFALKIIKTDVQGSYDHLFSIFMLAMGIPMTLWFARMFF